MRELLVRLSYAPCDVEGVQTFRHPEGRRVIFLGDLVDRGPNSPGVLELAMNMVKTGDALCVPGNHEVKLMRKLRGRDVRLTHGLAETMAQLEGASVGRLAAIADFIDNLVSHYVLDAGRLVVAHAGMTERYQGRASGRVRNFALYGETTGETDEYGLPVRYKWAEDYRGQAMVVYGHTPVPEPEWVNRAICIDTGCVFGGKLTALRYPERELVQVDARRVYYEPARPLAPSPEAGANDDRRYVDLLDAKDVLGKRFIVPRLGPQTTVREENAAAAFEVISRFGIDPHWLIHLPPTMAPPATCPAGEWLEHPEQALAYYREYGIDDVVCEMKHMGSRAIVVLCRDAAVAVRRFRVSDGSTGAIYTRTGRSFFGDSATEESVLDRIRAAADAAALFRELETDWLCLDVEILPWSAKAGALVRSHYATVGAAATASLERASAALAAAEARGIDCGGLRGEFEERRLSAARYVEAYGRYCWKVEGLDGLLVAPFHLLASEGAAHHEKPHSWHLERLDRLCAADPAFLHATERIVLDLSEADAVEKATAWWLDVTARGGEGMVVKPMSFTAKGRKGILQPAIKCRGREYLRIIYGPEYTRPDLLERLRERGLSAKRNLALREFSLGIESLSRFVEGEPLHRVHECVFAVLALESEPVDPRL